MYSTTGAGAAITPGAGAAYDTAGAGSMHSTTGTGALCTAGAGATYDTTGADAMHSATGAGALKTLPTVLSTSGGNGQNHGIPKRTSL